MDILQYFEIHCIYMVGQDRYIGGLLSENQWVIRKMDPIHISIDQSIGDDLNK